MTATLARRTQVHSFLAEIVFPSGFLYLCEVGRTLIDAGVQQYQPRATVFSDIVEDNDGFIRGQIQIMQRGPYRIGNKTYATMSELLQVESWERRVVTIKQRTVDRANDTAVEQVSGLLTQVIEVTPTIVTFAIEPRSALSDKYAPKRELKKGLFSTDALDKLIPQDTESEPLPLAFGTPHTDVSHLFSAATQTEITQKINAAGIAPVGFSAVEVQRDADKAFFSWAEYVGGLTVPVSFAQQTSINPIDVFAYVAQLKGWARVWEFEGLTIPTTSYDGRCYVVSLPRQPYLVGSLVCSEYVEAESKTSGPAVDPENAIDGKQETYCTIPGGLGATGRQGVCWEIPAVSSLGHISHNTDDRGTAGGGVVGQNWEGDNRPAGIKFFALLAFPSGTTLPTTGGVDISMKFPGVLDDILFSNAGSYSVAQLTAAGMAFDKPVLITGNLELCATLGSADNTGWAGTQFADWKFAAWGDSGSSDYNSKLVNPSGGRDSRQFRVRIRSTLNQNLHVVSVGLLIGFKSELTLAEQKFLEQAMRRGSIENHPNYHKGKAFGLF